MNVLFFIYKLSRPRFWMYTAGPFIVGYTGGIKNIPQLFSFDHLVGFFIFLIPINLCIYGINDLFDHETDKRNPKKREKEIYVFSQKVKKIYIIATCISFLFLLTYAAFFLSGYALCIFALCIGLATVYSAPPFRLKTKPILDSLSNVFYMFPGIIGYLISAESFPPVSILAGASLYCIAMHLFSAIPDISSDMASGVNTSATRLGKRASLVLCGLLWVGAGASLSLAYPLLFVWSAPAIICFVLLLKEETDISTMYWYLPWINMTLGASWWIALVR